MADPTPPNDQNSSEIPLEDIDRLLEAEDPGFTKSLEEVRAVESDASITIDASAIDESLAVEEKFDAAPEKGFKKFRFRMRMALLALRNRLKARLSHLAHELWIFLKTRPKQFIFFSLKTAKAGVKNATVPLKWFRDASRPQRMAALLLSCVLLGALWVLMQNFRGVWLPQIDEPILHSFEPFADHVESFDVKDPGESFYSAFPQERHEFLFPKMKVNLRPTKENPLPMGAFEIIVLLDSKDTAIELRDREVELFDMLQRTFEEESFSDLESELGKQRLKSRIKRDLDEKLTQGWIKDINFKTFILKP